MSDPIHISGYPKQRLILKLWEDLDIDEEKIVFNADYGEKRAGFLWRSELLDESIKKWITYAETFGIEFKYTKFYGRIHSVGFENKL